MHGGAVPAAVIGSCVRSGVHNRHQNNRRGRFLERRSKQVLYGAMFVFLAYLCFVCIGLLGVHRVRVRVQLRKEGIRHHGSYKKQEQQHGNMSQKAIHLV